MVEKMYSVKEQNFVYDWADRWRGLFDMIFDYLRTDDTSRSPISPADLDQVDYQNLRSWFLDNEEMFLSIWSSFCTSRDWALDTNKDLIAEIKDAEDVLKNPFFTFYGPEDLYVFFRAHRIDKQAGEPDEKKAWEMAMDLLTWDAIAAEFVNWKSDGG